MADTKAYSSKIVECSEELSKRDMVKLKDTSNALKLDDLISDGGTVRIEIASYARIAVHNEKAEHPDYEVYVIVDQEGQKYVTGSNSFWRSLSEILDEMQGEAITIDVYKKPSKNYAGKGFITCSLV